MKIAIALTLVVMFAATCTQTVAASDAPRDTLRIASIDASPVFFELTFDHYAAMENLELMRHGQVAMPPHGVTDISSFSWNMKAGVSWIMDMEELLYLLPFIASDRPEDRTFAIDWVDSWSQAHKQFAKPNEAAWDGMTTSIRAMVLTYFLRRELQQPGGGISERLRELLAGHLASLRANPDPMASNHAVWKALALVELSRVFPDASTLDLGLYSLIDLAMEQVSSLGMHMEHAPMYHFVVLDWFDEIARYLESIPGFEWAGTGVLRDTCIHMSSAGYFLQDHNEAVIPIGDSFRRPVPELAHVALPPEERVLFDPEGGYACYKEPSSPGSGRQVVFNVQPSGSKFPFHFHTDAISLVYYYRGEAILGDAGAYDYGRSNYRHYVTSASAHNVAGPAFELFMASRKLPFASYVVDAGVETIGDDIVFHAKRRYRSGSLERTVTIPALQPSLVIDDTLAGDGQMVMFWHLGPDVASVTADSSNADGASEASWVIHTRAGRVFRLAVTMPGVRRPLDVTVKRGSETPMLGWYSPEFGVIVAADVIVLRFNTSQPVSLHTEVTLVDEMP